MLEIQLEGHARALRELIEPTSGTIELVVAPCEVWWDRGWFVRAGVSRVLETLGRSFCVEPRATHEASRSGVRLNPRR
jgi:hypothetical protein